MLSRPEVASQYEGVRAAYIKERPIYQELCDRGKDLLQAGLREVGVRGEVDGRVKDLVSYLRKMLRKPEYLSGERPIQDKAGLRIVLPYFDEEAAARAVIERFFEVDEREETVERLGADRLGYLAVHYIVRIREEFLDEEKQTLFEGLQMEVQVGSIAQRAWAEVSHELIYKGAVDVPVAYQRIVNRLVALMEVFDSEVARAREAIAQLPGFEVAPLVSELDRELLRYTSKVPDRGLSQLIVPPLAALYGEEPGAPSAKIQSWFTEKRDQIGELYANYEGNFEVNPLFYQPEAFLIYERADNDPTGLKSAWPEEIPRELLVSLTELWGNPVE
jgi:ppGpp synthetase/RelA/SpoT-type nucleotidyltranferase